MGYVQAIEATPLTFRSWLERVRSDENGLDGGRLRLRYDAESNVDGTVLSELAYEGNVDIEIERNEEL